MDPSLPPTSHARCTLEITHLGDGGDGVGRVLRVDADGGASKSEPVTGGSVYVPYTLPGEQVTARVETDDRGTRRGREPKILTPSPDRGRPVCRHFGRCGGCAVQHLEASAYEAWKRNMLARALRDAGLEAATIAPSWVVGSQARRRATFRARRTKSGVMLGYAPTRGDDIVALQECPVLNARIVDKLEAVRRIVRPMLSRRDEARIQVTAAANGLAVDITGLDATAAHERARPQLADMAKLAEADGLLRVTVEGEAILQIAMPEIAMGQTCDPENRAFQNPGGLTRVPLPPGAFLQAAAEAEAMIGHALVEMLEGRRALADLFCGLGAFTFPLAQHATVVAYDAEGAQVDALAAAVDRGHGLRPVRGEVRDLFREPLSPKELAAFDGIVIDPPRAGALAQVRSLAQPVASSKLRTVAMVSCNPKTFARDARVLVDGGFRMGAVQPVDQFRYSPHLEVVAAFERS